MVAGGLSVQQQEMFGVQQGMFAASNPGPTWFGYLFCKAININLIYCLEMHIEAMHA